VDGRERLTPPEVDAITGSKRGHRNPAVCPIDSSHDGTSLAAMPLSREEREQFLAEPHIAALSVNAGDGRGPLTVPIWYQYEPGGDPWLLTGLGSRKHRLIESAGQFTLMAERLDPTVRYVAVDGAVGSIEPGTDEQLVEMTKRYLPPEKVDGYLEVARREHGESVAIRLTPKHWLSADLGGL
jgi:hypothetical protein